MRIDGRIDLSQLSSEKQQRLGQAQTPEQMIEVLAADGQIDATETAVIEEIQAELEANDGNRTLTLESSEFEARSLAFGEGNLSETANTRASSVRRDAETSSTRSTYRRAESFRNIDNPDALKLALESDQRIAGENEEGSRTRYGTGTVAGKILLQDAILAESTGVLTPDEARLVDEMAEKVRSGSINALTADDVRQLDALIETVLTRINGDAPPVIQRPDLQALAGIEGSAPQGADYDLVHDNTAPVLAEADAAVHDIELATQELGLSNLQMREQRASDIERGRSYIRMADAIEHAGEQLPLIRDTLQPALEAQVSELDGRIAARVSELEAAGVQEPELSNDSSLQTLRLQRSGSVEKYAALQQRSEDLAGARVSGLRTLRSVQVITSEMQDRVASVQTQIQDLRTGSSELANLKRYVEEDIPQITGTDRVDSHQQQLEALESVQGQAETIQDTLVGGMDGLLQKYRASRTANPQTIALLEQELASLRALSWDRQNPAAAVEALESARASMIDTLQSLVPQHLSLEEFRALRSLDSEVSNYSGQRLSTVSSTSESREVISQMLERALEEQADITAAGDNQLESMMEMERSGGGLSLAYGSGATISLSLTGGIGGSIGDEDFVALTARIGVGVEAALTVEKAYGKGPNYIPGETSYLAYIDLKAKLEGELSLDTFLGSIGVEFDASVGWRGGLAFASLDQAREFGNQLVSAIALSQLLPEKEAEFQAAADELKRQFDQYAYSGTTSAVTVEGRAGRGEGGNFAGLGGSYSTSSETMTYSDGTRIQDETTTGSVTVGLGRGRSATFSYSDFTSSDVTRGADSQPASRRSFSVAIPVQTMTQIIDHLSRGGSRPFSELVDRMGDSFMTSFVDHFKALNPNMAALTAAQIVAAMDQTITGNPAIFTDMVSTARYTDPAGSGGSSVVLGIARSVMPTATPPDDAPRWSLSFGIQGSYTAEASASSGAFYGKMEAGLSYRLGGSIPLPIGE